MKTLLKRSAMFVPLMMGLALANPASPAGAVMDFGALDTLQALGKTEAVIAFPVKSAPSYIGEIKTASVNDTGSLKDASVELLTEIKPDFIVISPRLGGKAEELGKIAPVINFAATGDDYFAAVSQNVLALAKQVNAETEANTKLNELNAKLDDVRSNVAKSDKTALVMMHNGGKTFAAPTGGAGKFIHNFLGVKNAVTAAPSEERQAVNAEFLAEVQPDVIYIVDRSAAIGQDPMALDTFKNEVVSTVKTKDGNDIKVVYLEPALWYLSGNGLMSVEAQAKEVEAGLQ